MFGAVKIYTHATWMTFSKLKTILIYLQHWLILKIMHYKLLRIWPISVVLVLITQDAILTINGSIICCMILATQIELYRKGNRNCKRKSVWVKDCLRERPEKGAYYLFHVLSYPGWNEAEMKQKNFVVF